MKVVNKYAGGKELINFDFIYLLNKMYYQFPYETLIRVNKLHRGFLPQLDKYISNREINFTLKTELRDRDKKTLASQILLNLEDNDLSKVTGANNGILKKVADIWIGI